MPEDLSRLKNALLPRYVVDAEIARGGMATVYLATDERLGRKVAVKVLKPELASGLASHRFEREISIAAGLSHRHLVPVYDCGESEGFLYYVMPYVEGETLREALDREGPFTVERALEITRDVAEGLEYAHERGFIHRDIKPQNILLTGGYAVVTDFGVARALEVAAGDAFTSEGVAVGTPAYMSPEQAEGTGEVGAQSDMYSLACVVYEMLAGTPPFHAATFREMLARQLFGTIPSPREERPELPRGTEYVIRRALAKLPERRFESITEFVESLDAAATGDYRRPARETWADAWRTPVIRWGAIPVLALIIGLPMRSLLLARRPPPFEGRPASAVVLPFSSADDEESGLAREVADALVRQLNYWEAVHVVPSVSLGGTLLGLGLRRGEIDRVVQGIEVAKTFGVQALVVVSASRSGDTAFAQATLFDAGSGRQVGRALQARGPPSRIGDLADAIAREILDLDEQPIPLDELRRVSASPEALVQEAAATRALESWQLAEAERGFRAAIDLDSTYAIAKHRLAQTLYWRAARAPEQLRTLGPEIAALSASAIAGSSDLPTRDSLHIRAFFSFQLGDFEDARARYAALVEGDSTDVYAWLMAGSVEFDDPWLVAGPGGALTPRSDLNRAVTAFTRAVRLQPTFQLGYGHLFDIYREVRQQGGCPLFLRPGGGLVTPWDPEVPDRREDFCAVPTDSLVWVRPPERPPSTDPAVQQRAAILFNDAIQLLRQWAAYAPANPRPHEELYLALTQELARDRAMPPERRDSLVSVALEHAVASLELRPDTTASDLTTLGLLHLAADAGETAASLVERGLTIATSADSTSVARAANLFLATGQPLRAVELISYSPVRRYSEHASSGALVPWGVGQTRVDRVRALGSSGVSGDLVRQEMRALQTAWSEPRYSTEDIALLRADATMYLAIGLAFDQTALAEWGSFVTNEDPVWMALAAGGAPEATDLLDRAVTEDSPALSAPVEAFIEGLVAYRLSRFDLAVRLMSKLDSLQASFRGPDVAWALQPVSWFIRGAAYEELGEAPAAIDHYSRFVTRWAGADSTARSLVAEATRRLERLGVP